MLTLRIYRPSACAYPVRDRHKENVFVESQMVWSCYFLLFWNIYATRTIIISNTQLSHRAIVNFVRSLSISSVRKRLKSTLANISVVQSFAEPYSRRDSHVQHQCDRVVPWICCMFYCLVSKLETHSFMLDNCTGFCQLWALCSLLGYIGLRGVQGRRCERASISSESISRCHKFSSILGMHPRHHLWWVTSSHTTKTRQWLATSHLHLNGRTHG